MDEQSKQAVRVLEALCASNERLIALVRDLRMRPEVLSVRDIADIRDLRLSGPTLGLWIDAELRDGRAIAWILDIAWDEERWIVELSVELNPERDEGGSRTIHRFPDRTARDLTGFITQLEMATSDLINHATSTDMSDL